MNKSVWGAMELRILRSFLAVAREGSISGAARTLHISQPALSRRLLELEAELGTALLHRGKGKMGLTEQGLLLRKRAEQLIELEEKTREELAAAGRAVAGTIHLGAGESRTFRIVARALQRLLTAHPNIRFSLFSGNAEDVMERLDKGLLDFGLLIEPYDVTRYDSLRLQAVDTWGVLMRRDCELARKDAVAAADLRELPLICSRQALEGGQIASWLGAVPAKAQVVGTYNLLFNAALMVEAGIGYALCLDDIIQVSDTGALRFRPLKPALESHVDLVWKKAQAFSRPAALLLSHIRETGAGDRKCADNDQDAKDKGVRAGGCRTEHVANRATHEENFFSEKKA